jgi:two-component system nitrate/nitrite response regulator NarL
MPGCGFTRTCSPAHARHVQDEWLANLRAKTFRGTYVRKSSKPNGDLSPDALPEPVVWLADPHPLMRAGLRSQLEGNGFRVLAEFSSIDDMAARTGETDLPQLIIVDHEAAHDTVGHLKSRFPHSAVILLGGDAEIAALASAFAAGADGYLLKNISPQALVASCRLAMLGEKVFPRVVSQFLGSSQSRGHPAEPQPTYVGQIELSDRELCVVRSLAAGQTNKCIANHLNITEATVKVNLKAILRKLGASNRTQVAIWALQNNLKPLESAAYVPSPDRTYDAKVALQ